MDNNEEIKKAIEEADAAIEKAIEANAPKQEPKASRTDRFKKGFLAFVAVIIAGHFSAF
jgi:hypothetical protein